MAQTDIKLTTGFTYKFDTADSSNTGYTLKFAVIPGASHPVHGVLDAAKYSDSVTFGEDANGNVISPGSSGAYTQITINESTLATFYYYGETGLYFDQRSADAYQKITHTQLRSNFEDINTNVATNASDITNLQANEISHTPTSWLGTTAINKFLMATNASGSTAVWRDLGEGGSVKIDHILADGVEITGTSLFDSHVIVLGDINCSQTCNVNTFTASTATFSSGITVTAGGIQTSSLISSGTIKANVIHAPTTGTKTLLVKGGDANGSNLLLGTHDTYYRANKHYFYARGGGSTPTTNNMHTSSTYGGVFFNGSPKWSSDDRLKHNEEDITDALSTIRKLNAQKYQKTAEPKEADFVGQLTEEYIEETGFIAQEVMQIPELAYCVSDGQTANARDIFYLNYNDIFVVNVQAVKELDAKVTLLEARLAALEKR